MKWRRGQRARRGHLGAVGASPPSPSPCPSPPPCQSISYVGTIFHTYAGRDSPPSRRPRTSQQPLPLVSAPSSGSRAQTPSHTLTAPSASRGLSGRLLQTSAQPRRVRDAPGAALLGARRPPSASHSPRPPGLPLPAAALCSAPPLAPFNACVVY